MDASLGIHVENLRLEGGVVDVPDAGCGVPGVGRTVEKRAGGGGFGVIGALMRRLSGWCLESLARGAERISGAGMTGGTSSPVPEGARPFAGGGGTQRPVLAVSLSLGAEVDGDKLPAQRYVANRGGGGRGGKEASGR